MLYLRLLLWRGNAKRKIFLCKKTEAGNNNSRKNFRNSRENMAYFNKEFQEDIVEPDTTAYYENIPHQLNSSPHLRFRKHYKFG